MESSVLTLGFCLRSAMNKGFAQKCSLGFACALKANQLFIPSPLPDQARPFRGLESKLYRVLCWLATRDAVLLSVYPPSAAPRTPACFDPRLRRIPIVCGVIPKLAVVLLSMVCRCCQDRLTAQAALAWAGNAAYLRARHPERMDRAGLHE